MTYTQKKINKYKYLKYELSVLRKADTVEITDTVYSFIFKTLYCLSSINNESCVGLFKVKWEIPQSTVHHQATCKIQLLFEERVYFIRVHLSTEFRTRVATLDLETD